MNAEGTSPGKEGRLVFACAGYSKLGGETTLAFCRALRVLRPRAPVSVRPLSAQVQHRDVGGARI